MVCTRKTKTLVSTCVILSGMTNIICLLYVGWVTNYIATVQVKVQEPAAAEKKLDEDKGDTLRIIERLDHLENVIKQHIQGSRARARRQALGAALSRARWPGGGVMLSAGGGFDLFLRGREAGEGCGCGGGEAKSRVAAARPLKVPPAG